MKQIPFPPTCILLLATGVSLIPAAFGQGVQNPLHADSTASADRAQGAMPVAQQDALVRQYCAVCHTDANPQGGLSLEKFNAADLDPGLAAMMVSKLRAKALGASGQALPDRATQDALFSALSAASAGANEWVVSRTRDPRSQAPVVTAGIVRSISSVAPTRDDDLYRLTIACNMESHQAQMQLTWSPQPVPQEGAQAYAAWDGNAPFAYRIGPGEGAAVLYATNEDYGEPKLSRPFPQEILTVRGVFLGQTVVFPFNALTAEQRRLFSTCFKTVPSGR
jgi:hypothetical protein